MQRLFVITDNIFEKADQSEAEAQFTLGHMYADGGVRDDMQ